MQNILIGISSSIAAYKIYELIRMFQKKGYSVKTVLSDNALNFVSPLVLETLSKNKCYHKQFETREDTQHIHLVDWADLFILAPASANTISKCATGAADNLLTSVFCAYLGSKKPVLIAPAMNTNMWENPIIRMNLDILETYCETAEPETGYLACGYEGKGRLCNIDIIYQKALRLLNQNKNNNSKKVLVTIGGTKEKIDNVRVLTNLSSGKMGSAIADWAYYSGYDTAAIATNELSRPYKVINTQSAQDMLKAIQEQDFDYLIMAAAVGDFRAREVSKNKISKEDMDDVFNLELEKNPDVVAAVAKEKKEGQIIAGFCLGDVDLIENAKRKLEAKNLDFIVANDISALDSEKNKVTIIDKSGRIVELALDCKENIARKILEVICD